MIDIEKSSKFLKGIKDNDSVEKLIKQKDNLSKLLKIILKEINNDIDIDTLNNLDDSQMWAFIYNNSSQLINNFKNKTKNVQDILDELTENINDNEKNEYKNLGKKTKREKQNKIKDKDKIEEDEVDEKEEEIDEDEDEDEINEEEEDMNENINEEIGGENKKNKKDKDIFFSMKDLNNFADQFEEEDNNNLKSAPNKLKLSSSRNKKSNIEENEDEEMEDDENNSLYSEEQEIKAEIDSEEEIKFDKFFDKPTKDAKNSDMSEDSDIDENQIFSQIKEIEQKMISNKKEWSTRGEILGKERPKDSLLTKAMDFEVALKAPPIPDREYTDKLEAMIKQRIKDDLFDDPIKKQIINLNENKRANDNELNFDKSKKGLGEIYEEKYLGNEKTETKADEIKKDCDDLCNKLFDIFKQMTNGSATPYGIRGKQENEINITNMPAIQIEEVGNFISDNKDMIKSGKEMFNPYKIRNKNKEEMTSEELRNIHNRKKRNIKNRIHEKERKRKLNELTQQLGSKFEAKIKMKQDKDKKMQKIDKSNTTEYKSTKFFGKISEMAEKEGEKKRKKINENND